MKKLTNLELLKKINDETDRLAKDEGAWLKSLGSLGDMARLVLALQTELKELKDRITKLEGTK